MAGVAGELGSGDGGVPCVRISLESCEEGLGSLSCCGVVGSVSLALHRQEWAEAGLNCEKVWPQAGHVVGVLTEIMLCTFLACSRKAHVER